MKRLFFLMPLLVSIFIYSCEKTNSPNPEPEPITPTNNWDKSAEAYLRDSTLYFTKLFSLWQSSIPPVDVNDILDSVKVRNITKKYSKSEDLLEYLIGLTPKNPANGKPYDRFSFLDRQGSVNEEIQNAKSTSYGIYVMYLQTEDSYKDNNNAHLYIRMVDKNSFAYAIGLRRGDRILSINGNTKYDYNTQKTQNFKGINDALNSETMTIKWKKPNGEEFEKTLNSVQYSIDPVLSTWVKNFDNSKVGYFAFSSFLSINNTVEENGKIVNKPTALYNQLENLFNSFDNENLDYLIVDLRYNGGGSTATAEYLANRIVPNIANNKRMYYYKVNPIIEDIYKETNNFKPVNFTKRGNLNLKKVYFLVTESTASASELMINSLKPYMNVQVVGSENTYGKPVGFWGYPIGKQEAHADLYVTMFQMFNADNFGDYFNGLVPNKLTREDFQKDFGDESEGFIAEAIYHIKNGSYSSGTRSAVSVKDAQRINNTHLIKNVNNRLSDVGMFKFDGEKLELK